MGWFWDVAVMELVGALWGRVSVVVGSIGGVGDDLGRSVDDGAQACRGGLRVLGGVADQ